MHLRYMAAALRNHCRKDDPLTWGPQELMDSFALLPTQIPFEQWAASPLVQPQAEEEQGQDPLDRLKSSDLVEKGIVSISEG